MPKGKNKYKYFTEVSAQLGTYTVKHLTKADLRDYEKALKKQHPYFRKVRSGVL
jgi:hypothetical protein